MVKKQVDEIDGMDERDGVEEWLERQRRGSRSGWLLLMKGREEEVEGVLQIIYDHEGSTIEVLQEGTLQPRSSYLA